MKKYISLLSLLLLTTAWTAPVMAEATTKAERTGSTANAEELLQSSSEEILNNSIDQLNQRESQARDSDTGSTETTETAEPSAAIDQLNEAEQPEESNQSEESTEEATQETEATDQIGTRAAVTLEGPTKRQLPVDTSELEAADNVAIRTVSSQTQLENAFNLKNDGKNITLIQVVRGFKITQSAGPGTGTGRTPIYNAPNRVIILEGNGYAIEFTGKSYQFTGTVDIVVQNLRIGNGNAWGIFDGYEYQSANRSVFTFHDITQAGTQLYEGGYGKVILSGATTLENGVSGRPNYVSPFDGQTYNFTYDSAYYNSSSIEAGQIYIKEGSNIIARSGMKGSNFAVMRNGNFYIEPGEPTTVTIDNNIVSSASVPNWVIADYSPAAIAINYANFSSSWPNNEVNYNGQTNNLFYIPKSATVEIINGQSRRVKAAVLDFTGANTRAQIDGTLKITSYGDSSKNAALDINSEFSGGEVPVEFRRRGTLALGDGAHFEMNLVNATSNSGHALMMRGTGSQILIGKNATFKIHSDTSDTNSSNGTIIYTGTNSTINVDEKGTFDIAKTRTNANALMNLGSSTLTVSNMHAIRLWNNGTAYDATETWNWQPLKNTSIRYSGTGLSSKGTESSHPPSKTGFDSNFSTNNRQRVVIEPPTPVTLTINHQKYKHSAAEGQPEIQEIESFLNQQIDTDFGQYQKNYPGYTYRRIGTIVPTPLPEYMPLEGIEVELEYTYDGSIKVNYPDIYDFGSHAISLNSLHLFRPQTLDSNGAATALTVTDDRYETSPWALTLKETQPLTVHLSGGATQTLAGCLYYGNQEISSTAQQVEADEFASNVETVENISDSWSETTGLMLKVPVDQQYAGSYSGELIWTFTAAPVGP